MTEEIARKGAKHSELFVILEDIPTGYRLTHD